MKIRTVFALGLLLSLLGGSFSLNLQHVSAAGDPVSNGTVLQAGTIAMFEDVGRNATSKEIESFAIWGGILQGPYSVGADHNAWSPYADEASAQQAACQQAKNRRAAYPSTAITLINQPFTGTCPATVSPPSPSPSPTPTLPVKAGVPGSLGCPIYGNILTAPIVDGGCIGISTSLINDTVPAGWLLIVEGKPAAPPVATAKVFVLYVDTNATAFSDISNGARYQVAQLVARGIVHGYGDGTFGPNDQVLRSQMAAFIVRAMGKSQEDHGNSFTDRGPVDDELWRNVGTLGFLGIAHGYGNGTFGPMDPVLNAQTISFITRMMVTMGYWQYQPENPALYPNVSPDSGHRIDIATYVHYTGADVNTGGPQIMDQFINWDQPATREFFVVKLWQALEPTVKNPNP